MLVRFTGGSNTLWIPTTAIWPAVSFRTDVSGPHTWRWTIRWRGTFSRSGEVRTALNEWDARTVLNNLGGDLALNVAASHGTSSTAVQIRAKNPSAAEVVQYLQSNPADVGFGRIIGHESKFVHFDGRGEPVRSFDGGYGLCQLTTPAPSYEQVWNWKANVDAGLALFRAKQTAAIAYLSQAGRTYTSAQLLKETICRWNGGRYHIWDRAAGRWARPANILCDGATGNIGWDLNDPVNAGMTGLDLQKRDHATYSRGRTGGAHWRYFGVCYADKLVP